MWNLIQIIKSRKSKFALIILAIFLLVLFSTNSKVRVRFNNPFAENKPVEQLEKTYTISQDEAISIVRNLPEVKNFFEISNEATGSSTKYEPQIIVEKHEDNLWYLWVFENVRYDTGIGHVTTFNRYIVDSAGKIKCSFAIYEGTKLVKVSSEKEYPCI